MGVLGRLEGDWVVFIGFFGIFRIFWSVLVRLLVGVGGIDVFCQIFYEVWVEVVWADVGGQRHGSGVGGRREAVVPAEDAWGGRGVVGVGLH